MDRLPKDIDIHDIGQVLGGIEITLFHELSDRQAKALHQAKKILRLLEDEDNDE